MWDCSRTSQFTQQPRLFSAVDEAMLFHSNNASGGFFAHLARTNDTGKLLQRCYPVRDLQEVLQLIDTKRDNYLSVAEFWSPKRRVVNVKSVEELFCDVDCDGMSWTLGRKPEALASCIRFHCQAEGIPEPSVINWSGRGLHLKWLLTKPMPQPGLVRWNLLQDNIIKRFESFGADSKARDAARVLRCVQTINQKNLDLCRTVDCAQDRDGNVQRYDFDYLAEFFLPYTRAEVREYKDRLRLDSAVVVRERPELRRFTYQTLAWARVCDLRELIRLRGVITEGMRMNYALILLSELALSQVATPSTFWEEAAHVAKEVDPTWTVRTAEFRTLYAKVCAAARGEKVTYRGQEVSPIYTFTTQRIMEELAITPEEEAQLQTLCGRDMLLARRREKKMAARRESGVVPRQEYLDHACARKERARSLAGEGLGVRAIAREMGLSPASISGYLR